MSKSKSKPKHRRPHWTDEFKSPKAVASTAKRNPQLVAFTGAVAGAGAAEKAKDNLPKKHQKKADLAHDAVYGAAGGQAAYQLAGYAAKHGNRKINDPKVYKNPKTHRGGYTKPEYKKAIEGAKDAHGKRDKGRVTDWKSVYRNYPKDVPGGKVIRVVSRTHGGKSGMLVGTAATVAGGVAGVKLGQKDRDKVSKHASDPFEISKISAKTKIAAGVKRGLFDSLGVTKPAVREKAYAGNGPIKGKLYNIARTKTRTKTEQPLKDLRDHPAVKQAAFRMVKEDAAKKLKAAKPYVITGAAGTAAGGAGVYAAKDEFKKNLSQEQIDRRKKVQAVTSKTTGALGLGALGAQAVGLGVSRGKIKRLPTLQGGKPGLRNARPKKDSKKIKDATVPLLATSAGIGSLGAFNFASYTKAEAQQKKKAIPQ